MERGQIIGKAYFARWRSIVDQKQLNLGFVTTLSGRWPRELPARRDEEYASWLAAAFPGVNLVRAREIAVDNESVARIAAGFKACAVDLIVVLIGAFTGDFAAVALGEELKVPIILWAPREPPFDGGRLMANSLVAATMNAAALNRMDLKYHFVYGDRDEERVGGEVARYIRVYGALKRLRHTYLGLLGYRPTAFYSSTFDETLIRKRFGLKMEEFDLKMVFDLAEKVDPDKLAAEIREFEKTVRLVNLPEGHLENHCRLYLALERFFAEQGFDAVSLKCWPEMGFLKYTPCAVLSRFAEKGFVIGCESDVDATITMLIQTYLTGQAVFMGDLVTIDERENTALFWHCGQAAGSLKDPERESFASNHPLAGQGVVFETTLKPGRVTIARMSKIGGGYKLFLTAGQAVPTEKVVKGVMVNVVLDDPVLRTVYRIAAEGVPHHYGIVWADVREDLRVLCAALGIEVLQV